MEGAIAKIVESLLGLGLPGIIILAQGFINWKLYTRNQELHTTLYDVGRESVKAHESTVAALDRLSNVLLRSRAPE